MSTSNSRKRLDDMTKTHLSNIMQIMVFQLNDRVYYGINVSKIRSIEDFRRYKIIKNNIKNEGNKEILEGYIEYQKKVIPFLNIEKWLAMYKENHEYKVTIVAEFNKRTIAFPIYDIDNIYNVPVEKLQTAGVNKDVITYSTLLNINGVEETCLILDVEELLVEVFGVDKLIEKAEEAKIETPKSVLIAEDSKSARFIIDDIMQKTNIEYKLFEDGEKIINYLTNLNESEIEKVGLIITDLEMPHKDGYQVISFIQKEDKLKHIPIVVNSSMSNSGVIRKTEQLGASGFIAKTDPEKFIGQIKEHILK